MKNSNHFLKNQKKVVLLIDAENIPSTFAEEIIQNAEKYGTIVVKRIYGDWQSPCIKSWKQPSLFYSITPCQQFSITEPNKKTKNTTDIALIVDAMTFLYEKEIDTFCIVSSDSDFYTLVRILREKNKEVIGMGTKHVNENYKNAFAEFILLQEQETTSTKISSTSLQKQQLQKQQKSASKQNQAENKVQIKKQNHVQKNLPDVSKPSKHKTKLKVYLLSVIDCTFKKGKKSVDCKILQEKLEKHEKFANLVHFNSKNQFISYLEKEVITNKWKIVHRQNKALIEKS